LNSITSSVTTTENMGTEDTSDDETATTTATNEGLKSITFGDDGEDSIEITHIADDVALIDMKNNTADALDLDAIITSEEEQDLVFVGNDGDVIDFGESKEWTASTESTTVDGVEGSFTEYTSTSSDISVFVNDKIETIHTDF
jgi:hypothetical protein